MPLHTVPNQYPEEQPCPKSCILIHKMRYLTSFFWCNLIIEYLKHTSLINWVRRFNWAFRGFHTHGKNGLKKYINKKDLRFKIQPFISLLRWKLKSQHNVCLPYIDTSDIIKISQINSKVIYLILKNVRSPLLIQFILIHSSGELY